jgi:hypothetical protein
VSCFWLLDSTSTSGAKSLVEHEDVIVMPWCHGIECGVAFCVVCDGGDAGDLEQAGAVLAAAVAVYVCMYVCMYVCI